MTDKEEIIDLYRRENQAMVDKDIVTLKQILVPTMQLMHMTGYVQPKNEWLDQIQNGQMKYFSSVEENIKDINIEKNHASLIGQNKVKANIWGSGVATWRLQMKVNFIKVDGKWMISDQVASTY
ncbi:nuclear transport factor 2 family protein [Lactobacillus sp. PV034]|uniref:nuclear transport factor 2 family protein n=1 Tax=Lactobacillus sp. PV034 TaxID=2594495 RepID=UPI00223EFA10|nr:nuclear transport factor 2 family protein [Lactobacillus sp. PV034]QNQ80295.1 nuclear transport factor 2 family protein [Lactobacillus sp. PV034]